MSENSSNFLDYGIAALIIKNGKYLLIKNSRKEMFGCWTPPNGQCETCDQGEKDCVIREVLEKVNLNVKPIKKIWTAKGDTKVKTISFWLVEVIDGKIKINKRKSSNYDWFSLNEIMKLKLYPATKHFFQLLQENKVKI